MKCYSGLVAHTWLNVEYTQSWIFYLGHSTQFQRTKFENKKSKKKTKERTWCKPEKTVDL